MFFPSRNLWTTVVALANLLCAYAGLGQSAAPPPDLVITLERTACYGECPVYKVSIDGNGSVTYDGSQFVRVQGRKTARISPSEVGALFETAERTGFFDLHDQYRIIHNADGTETTVTDQPTTFVSITGNGRSKRVEDYVGAPESLKRLEEQIDEAARTVRWVRIDAQTLQELVRRGWSPTAKERSDLLRIAIRHDDVAVIKGLIGLGADPNGKYFETNTTPLMMVRSAAAARVLLEAGASPSARNDNGYTPLAWATHLASDVTDLLLKAGARVDGRDNDGRTALWDAACYGNFLVVHLLIRAGADPTVGDMAPLKCSQKAREDARVLKPSVLDDKPPFTRNFDFTIAELQQAIANPNQQPIPGQSTLPGKRQ